MPGLKVYYFWEVLPVDVIFKCNKVISVTQVLAITGLSVSKQIFTIINNVQITASGIAEFQGYLVSLENENQPWI